MFDLYLGREGGGKSAPLPLWPHTSPLTKTMLAQNSQLKLQFLRLQAVELEICIVFCAP